MHACLYIYPYIYMQTTKNPALTFKYCIINEQECFIRYKDTLYLIKHELKVYCAASKTNHFVSSLTVKILKIDLEIKEEIYRKLQACLYHI